MAVPSTSDTVIVVAGGDPLDPAHLPGLPAGAVVIAADSGVDRALALGLCVDLVIGDLDSVTPEGLQAARDVGATIDRHPTVKDASDLELALDSARRLRPARILVLGGHGGRLDHLLANALLLAGPITEGIEVVAQMGPARVTVIRTRGALVGPVGGLVTLLAVGGPAGGITTDGLRYPLQDEPLLPGSTRGISNELTTGVATVRLRSGVLLAVQPGPDPGRSLPPDAEEMTP